ncbi:MAG: tetratricopeptide repeat protein [Phycisphaerales bacterium]
MARSPRALALATFTLALPTLAVQSLAQPNQPRAAAATKPDDAAYRAATGMLQRGLTDLAADEFRRFLADHADHARAPHAKYGLAICLARQAKHADAATILEGLDAISDFEFAPDAALLRGQCSLIAGDHAAAAIAFRRVLNGFPSFDSTHAAALGLGESLYRALAFDDARAALERVARDWPESSSRPRAELLMALCDAAESRDKQAAARLATLRDTWPDDEVVSRAALAEAASRARLGQHEQAESLYARAATDSALAPEAALGIARLRREARRPSDALAASDDFLRRWSESPLADAARLERARALLDLAKPDDALATLRSLSKSTAPDLADDAAYWSAKALLRRGDFEEVASLLADFPRRFGSSELIPDAAYDLGVSLTRANKHADAARAFASFSSAFPKHDLAPEALAAEASARRAAGDLNGAAEACDRFLAAYPKHARAASIELLHADCDQAAGRDEPAAERYARALAAAPDAPDAASTMVRLALVRHRLGETGAAELLRRALDRKPPPQPELQVPAWTVLADVAIAAEDWPAAQRWLELRTRQADSAEVRLKLGIACARQGLHAPALEHFTDALTLDGASPAPWILARARFERGQSLEALGRAAEARAEFEAVVADDDKALADAAIKRLAALASRDGRHADAAALLGRVADGESADPAVLHDEASALLAAGEYAKAEAALDRFLATKPDTNPLAEARAERAIAIARQERFDEALTLLDEVESAASLLSNDLLAASRADRAWVLARLGRANDAAFVYRSLLDSETPPPLAAHAALELAWIEASASRWEASLALLDRARVAPSVSATACRATYLRGLCLLRLNRAVESAEALAPFTKELISCDSLPSALLALGEAQAALGKNDAATSTLRAAIDAKPDDDTLAAALLALGQAESAANRWNQSRAAFNRYLERWPEGPAWFQARFGIGWALESDGHHDDAIAAYRQITSAHQGPTAARAQFQIGQCLFALNRLDEASRELLKVDILYAYPQWSAAALYEAGRCLLRLNRTSEARQVLSRVIEQHADTRWAVLAKQRLDESRPESLPGRPAQR